MSKENFDQELNQVIDALNAYPHSEITGALMGELIRRNAKSINIREIVGIPVGTGASSEFIRRYLSAHLVQTGRKGSDILYTIIRKDEDLQDAATNSSTNIWKSFVNPSNLDGLYIDNEKPAILTQLVASESSNTELLNVKSISENELENIQNEFTDKLAQGREQEPFVRGLREAKDNDDWFNLLRTTSVSDYRNWLTFRREKIERVFTSRLAAENLSEEKTAALLRIFRSSQLQATAARRKVYEAQTNPATQGRLSQDLMSEDLRFRQGILHAISSMSIDELRKLSLPYGAVFDALTHK